MSNRRNLESNGKPGRRFALALNREIVSNRANIVWLSLITVVWLWMFWPLLSGLECVAFRDSAYLYYPLFDWIDRQWLAGEIPFWNPHDDFGRPLIADGSSSVFYPGKLIFFCRALSFPSRFGIYVSIHVFLAAIAAYWLARVMNCRPAGAAVSAFAYGFGGPVLFQTSNVIYLVSAAWLPIALACVWKMLGARKRRYPVAVGVVCALMILGGDPQMAFHVILIAGVSVLWNLARLRRYRKQGDSPQLSDGGRIRQLNGPWRQLSSVALIVLVTAGLAAIQILPTWEWSQISERRSFDDPRNVYEMFDRSKSVDEEKPFGRFQGILGPLSVGTHHEHAYQFSQPPWSAVELFWPNITGKLFPTNTRWTSGLSAADRVWMPSIYIGLVAIILAIGSLRIRGADRRSVWLSWIGLVFGLASLGWYGFGWILAELSNAWPALFSPSELGNPVGGIYWLLVTFIPGYVSFRYPAKLFVICALALSILAGRGLNRISTRSIWWIGGLAVVGSIVAALPWGTILSGVYGDAAPTEFGAFDPVHCTNGVRWSFLHGSVVAGLVFVACYLCKGGPNSRRLVSRIIVVLAIFDIIIANRWMVPTVPSSVFQFEKNVNSDDADGPGQKAMGNEGPMRLIRPAFIDLISIDPVDSRFDDKFARIIRKHKDQLVPKYHLLNDFSLVGSFSSLEPADYKEFELSFWHFGTANRDELFGNSTKTRKGPGDEVGGEGGTKRFWLLDAGSVDLNTVSLEGLAEQMRSTEVGELESSIELIEYRPNQIVVRVKTNRDNQFLLNTDYWEKNWKASFRNLDTDTTSEVDIDRAMIFRAVDLGTAGNYEVTFFYSPTSYYLGAFFSGICWIALLVLCISHLASTRRFRRTQENGRSNPT